MMLDGMNERLPLATLLSFALTAFTIEFDNEFEKQMTHRTTMQGLKGNGPHAPWLVSLVMWPNCMQHIGEEGVSVRELAGRARTKTNLAGMERWGYITVSPDPKDPRLKQPRSAWIARATPAGRKAQEVWKPLFGTIERRWRERFGEEEIDRVRETLRETAKHTEIELPDCLPILGYGLFSKDEKYGPCEPGRGREKSVPDLLLSALLSKVLLAFAIEYEDKLELSLAISANLLRVLKEEGVRVRDLPELSGVSKEGIHMGMGILSKRGACVQRVKREGGPTRIAQLTAKGQKTREAYRRRIESVEERWREQYGKKTVQGLREALEKLAGNGTAAQSPLFQGLEPPPEGWRASVRRPGTLPHFPMVLHRGGFPDGS